MNQENDKSNSQPEIERKFSQTQYDILKRCNEKKDIAEWNQWRKKNPDEDILLEGASLQEFEIKGVLLGSGEFEDSTGTKHIFDGKVFMKGAILRDAEMENASFFGAFLSGADLSNIDLKNANLSHAMLESASLLKAHLEGAVIRDAYMKKADLNKAYLQGVDLRGTDLKNARLNEAHLEGTYLYGTHLENANLWGAHLQSASFRMAILSSSTLIRGCRVDLDTDFLGVGLDEIRIDPKTKQLLEYNIRRKNWENWHKWEDWHLNIPKSSRNTIGKIFRWPVRAFWWVSDYGLSTSRIIQSFFLLAILFAMIYYVWGAIDYYGFKIKKSPGIVSNLFVLEDSEDGKDAVSWSQVPIRSLYFSIITMTLGFGDMYANPSVKIEGPYAEAKSSWGHLLVMVQVIIGYVLLGALITRFAVLFQAGGPAGKFTPMDEQTRQLLAEFPIKEKP